MTNRLHLSGIFILLIVALLTGGPSFAGRIPDLEPSFKTDLFFGHPTLAPKDGMGSEANIFGYTFGLTLGRALNEEKSVILKGEVLLTSLVLDEKNGPKKELSGLTFGAALPFNLWRGETNALKASPMLKVNLLENRFDGIYTSSRCIGGNLTWEKVFTQGVMGFGLGYDHCTFDGDYEGTGGLFIFTISIHPRSYLPMGVDRNSKN